MGIDIAHARVLDVGTGTGLLIPHLRRAGFRSITGNDLSTDMLRVAEARFPDVAFEVGPAEELTVLPAPLDVVVGFSVLHHLPDLRRFFLWLDGVLRPGGVFGFADGNGASILLDNRRRWIVWTAVYPVHKPLRLLNRGRLRSVPPMQATEHYSDAHRALTRHEVLDAVPPTLEVELTTHGILAPTFNNALVGRPGEHALLRALRAVDERLPFQGEELWTFGTRRQAPPSASM